MTPDDFSRQSRAGPRGPAPFSGQPINRRQTLVLLGASAAGACLGLGARALPPASTGGRPASDDGALEEVLRQLQASEPRSLMGLSTHAPMAAEALCALGFARQAVPWLRAYKRPVLQLPPARRRIDPVAWREALGPDTGAATWETANVRWSDWKAFFTVELAERRWQDVLELWVGRLAPGMPGAATHGIIRASHAVRALARRRSRERLGELARGLAYWASSYEELPAVGRMTPRLDTFAAALDEVPLYREAFGKSPEGRNIVEVLRHVGEVPGFGDVRDAVILPDDLSNAFSALTATFTRVYLRYGTRDDTIPFIHAVTGPCALRRLAPHLSAETARAAFPYAWQMAAAIFSAYVRVREKARFEESDLTPDELANRAVRNGDEHAIKFTEVMLSEHRLNPDPVYLAAAEDAIGRL